MKNKLTILSSVFVSCALMFAGSAFADARHPNMPSGGHKCYPGSDECEGKLPIPPQEKSNRKLSHNKDNHMMNAPLKMDSVEKFKGTVKSVNRVRYPNGTQIEITLDTDEGVKKIVLGPARYIDQTKVKLQTGDKVTVKGYRITVNGDETIQASEVNKNGNILNLRDDMRQPMWEMRNHNNGKSNNQY